MPKINVTVVYKKDIVLKSASEDHLEEVEYVLSKTTYNTKGEVISEIQYDPDGNITQETIHEYDDRGFLVKEILRDGDGFIADHKTYERNDQGKVNREFRHYMDESFDTVKYFYDDQGVLVKKETIDPDQDLESIEEFTHWNGLLTHYLLKDDQGSVLAEKRMQYDNKGQMVELYDYDGSEDIATRKVTSWYPSGNKKEVLTYNEEDKLIEKVTFKEGKDGQVIQMVEEGIDQKNILNFEYDEHGNVIVQEEFDKNGELISKVKRSYNDHKLVESSQVFIDGAGRRPSRNYTLRQEYVYFDE